MWFKIKDYVESEGWRTKLQILEYNQYCSEFVDEVMIEGKQMQPGLVTELTDDPKNIHILGSEGKVLLQITGKGMVAVEIDELI